MPHTEMDRETLDGRKTRCPMDKCLGRVDVEICPPVRNRQGELTRRVVIIIV